ncbi:hypothetical protein [Streptomyces sp. C184]
MTGLPWAALAVNAAAAAGAAFAVLLVTFAAAFFTLPARRHPDPEDLRP